jgi:hypothetical protein
VSKAFVKEPEGDDDEDDDAPAPAAQKGGNHITLEGFNALKAELDRLWKVERPRVTEEVSVAAAEGDRSENAEYIYGKKKLREIDRRLRHLGQRLNAVTVVEPNEDRDDGKVYFGAWRGSVLGLLASSDRGERVNEIPSGGLVARVLCKHRSEQHDGVFGETRAAPYLREHQQSMGVCSARHDAHVRGAFPAHGSQSLRSEPLDRESEQKCGAKCAAGRIDTLWRGWRGDDRGRPGGAQALIEGGVSPRPTSRGRDQVVSVQGLERAAVRGGIVPCRRGIGLALEHDEASLDSHLERPPEDERDEPHQRPGKGLRERNRDDLEEPPHDANGHELPWLSGVCDFVGCKGLELLIVKDVDRTLREPDGPASRERVRVRRRDDDDVGRCNPRLVCGAGDQPS